MRIASKLKHVKVFSRWWNVGCGAGSPTGKEGSSATYSKELRKVLAGNSSDLFHLFAVDFGQASCRFNHSRRFVTLSAKRNRRQIGTIGFNHQTIKGKFLRDIAQVCCLLEGEIAGE